MSIQPDSTTTAAKSRRRFRWNLKTLLLVLIPTCAALAYGASEFRRTWRAVEARNLMLSKVIVSPHDPLADGFLHFRSGAVSDADLAAFVPAFNSSLPEGLGLIRGLDLNGSPVSDEAIARFRAAVPDCEIER